jgi:hypothetical protein
VIRAEIQLLLIFLSCIFLFCASFWNNDRSMGVCIVASRLYKILIEEVDSMRRPIFLAFFILSAGCLLATAQQQNSPTALRGELRRLLSMPAPTPRVADEAEKQKEKSSRPLEFYDSAKPPPDDAPIADLLDYWESAQIRRHTPQPSEATRRRLMAASESEPEKLPRFLNLLPEDAAAAERVKKLHDEALASDRFDEAWRKSVRDWLRFNSKYFLGELPRAICDRPSPKRRHPARVALAVRPRLA